LINTVKCLTNRTALWPFILNDNSARKLFWQHRT